MGGISSKNNYKEYTNLLNNLKVIHADIICVNEYNLDISQGPINRDVHDLGRHSIKE